jgi:hypothetical protein
MAAEPVGGSQAPGRSPTWERWGVAAIALAICWLYCWTASSNNSPFLFTGPRVDYYNLLLHGYLDGHTYLKVSPETEAAALRPDGTEAGSPLLDTTYYRGRIYLYFGPTPVVGLFLPYRLLTGGELSDNLAAALFAAAGFLVSLAVWRRVRRDYFPGSARWVGPVFAVLLGLGNACIIMLRRPLFYEAAIGAAYLCQATLFYALLRTLGARAAAGRLAWLGVCSLAAGLSVGARPVHAIGTVVTAFPLLWWWCQRGAAGGRRFRAREAWAAFGPLAACAAGLMAYNYQRFGSVLEFGISHQTSFPTSFSPTFILHNLKLYYFSLPGFSWYFPFLTPVQEAFRPAGYVGVEQVHGQAWATVTWLPVLLAAVWWWRERDARRRAGAVFLWAVLFCYLSNLAFLLCLAGRSSRYMVDFQPALMLLAGCAFLVGERVCGAGRPWRRIAPAGLVALATIAALHNGFASLQFYELFKQSNRATYERIATVLNAPSAWAGRWLEPDQGPIRMQVRFPSGRAGVLEPLLATGVAEYSDVLFVHYLDAGSVRFVLRHHGHGAVISDAITIAPGATHRLEIDLGSFYPPLPHPFFAAFGRGERLLIKQTLRVNLDGTDAFLTRTPFYDASPGAVSIGWNPYALPGEQPRFTGEIGGVQRSGLAGLVARKAVEEFGPIRMEIRLPQQMETREPEPLVVSGTAGRGDALFVKYDGPRQIRLGFDHWGGSSRLSGPIEVDPAAFHALEIWMGSLVPPAGAEALAHFPAFQVEQMRQTVRVVWNGREVFRTSAECYPAPPGTVDLGANDIGASSCTETFTGMIRRYSRGRISPAWAEPVPLPAGTARMQVKFPGDRIGRSEPLLATGAAGRGDLVFVTYLDADHVRFSHDHWGGALVTSPPVRIDYDGLHDLEIETSALRALAAPGPPPSAGLRLRLDGTEVMRADSPFFTPGRGEAWLGENPLGATTCEPRFGGTIVQADWGGIWDGEMDGKRDYGPVRFQLTLPERIAPEREPLLVTGRTGAADALLVAEVDAGHVRLVWDHWGVGVVSSGPIAVARGKPVWLEVEMGSLYPVESAAMSRALAPEEVARRRRQLRVTLNGAEVFRAEGAFHPAQASEVQVGLNQIGLSSAGRVFGGDLEAIQRPGGRP